MTTIDELTKYFGYYKSNTEFQKILDKILVSPTNYDSQTLYIMCQKTKLEIGFTNERMIRDSDKDKPIIGGRPIFTHFNIYHTPFCLFDTLPFEVVFLDKIENVREKAGIPTQSIDKKIPILGRNKMDTYDLDLISISFKYNNKDDSIEFIQVLQKIKKIVETSKE